jgi:methyl-accepting chemotaxis protein
MVFKAGGLVLGSTILAGAVGAGAIWALNDQITQNNQIGDVLRNHLESDMMHDALRSDVLAALASSNPAYGLSIADVKADLTEHSGHFLNMIDANAELTAGTELGAVIDGVKPELEAYIDTAMALVEAAATDEAAALAMLPGFLKSFGELETAMSEASDKISAASDETVSHAHSLGMMAQIAMLGSALLAVGAVIFIVLAARRRIVRPIVDLTGAMDQLAGGDTNVQAPHRDRDDEIGRMAGALTKFRENALNRIALESQQRALETERNERSRRVEALASAFGDQLASTLSTLRESSARLIMDAGTLEDVC